MHDRLDPELSAPLEGFLAFFGGGIDLHDIPATRAMQARMREALQEQLPMIEGVTSEDRRIPGPADAPDLLVRIYHPAERHGPLPAMVWIHGVATC